MDSILIWLPLMVWLGFGGWAFRHHVDQPNLKKDQLVPVFFFSMFFAPFSAGIAIYELQHTPPKAAKPVGEPPPD